MKALVALLMLGVATPAVAQHSGHTMPMGMPMPKPAAKPTPKPTATPVTKAKPKPKPAAPPVKKAPVAAKKPVAAKPRPAAVPATSSVSSITEDGATDMEAVDHGEMDSAQMGQGQMDMGEMDHSQMDHGQMDMGEMNMGAMSAPIPDGPPPAAAGSGPPRAADAIWGADAMRASRDQLRREHGGATYAKFMSDRLDYRLRDGKDGYLWDVDASYGGDINRVWIESEGEGSFGEDVEAAQVQLLYGRAITPWFDLQAGVRQDFTGPKRTYLDLGIQGLAPYLFELEGDVFLSSKGDLTATAEVELDQRITQRLILQPRGEIALAAQDVPELGIGAGIDTLELGLRLRYEIAREFAPYIGVEQEWKIGQSADFARAAGQDPSVTNFVVGVRFWF